MSQADRLQTTPASIHDAVEKHIPYRFRAEVNYLFWQLKQDAPVILDSAIPRAHEIATQLAALAQSQPIPGLYTDAEPASCVKVATYLNAAIDDARQRRPSAYPVGAVNDAASLPDSAAAYQAMVAYDTSAWHRTVAQPAVRQADSGPAQLGDTETEWRKMQARDASAWKGANHE
jgi:hypothetical protein